jgi:Flp pilus assembly protein TadB
VTGFGAFRLCAFQAQQALSTSLRQGLPEALDLMVSGLRAGHSLIAAMGLVGGKCPTRWGRIQEPALKSRTTALK